MNKNLTIKLCLLFFPFLTFGQSITSPAEILLGEEKKQGTSYFKPASFHLPGIGFCFTDGSGENLRVTLLDDQMKETKTVSWRLAYKGKPLSFRKVIRLGDYHYVIASLIDRKLEKVYIFAQKINPKTLLLDKKVELATLAYTIDTKYFPIISIQLSKDQTRLLLGIDLLEDQAQKRIDLFFFDEQLEQRWHKEVALSSPALLYEVKDWLVDSADRVYLLGKKYDRPALEALVKAPAHTFEVLLFSEQGKRMTPQAILMEGKYINDLKIDLNEEQDLIAAGWYSANYQSNKHLIGSLFFQLDQANTKIVKSKEHPFSFDFISQALTEKEQKALDKRKSKGKAIGLPEYRLDHLLPRADGSWLLLGQQYKNFSTSGTNEYNNIAVICLGKNGESQWTEKLFLRQSTSIRGYFYGYTAKVWGKDLELIFNDYKGSLDKLGTNESFVFRKANISMVVLAKINPDGQQSRQIISPESEDRLVVQIEEGCAGDDKNYLLFFQNRKKYQWAKLIRGK